MTQRVNDLDDMVCADCEQVSIGEDRCSVCGGQRLVRRRYLSAEASKRYRCGKCGRINNRGHACPAEDGANAPPPRVPPGAVGSDDDGARDPEVQRMLEIQYAERDAAVKKLQRDYIESGKRLTEAQESLREFRKEVFGA